MNTSLLSATSQAIARALIRAPAGQVAVELWIRDGAQIHTKRVGKQKTDRQDPQLLLRLMMGNFLLAGAVQETVSSQPEWRHRFFHLAMRRARNWPDVEPGIGFGDSIVQQHSAAFFNSWKV